MAVYSATRAERIAPTTPSRSSGVTVARNAALTLALLGFVTQAVLVNVGFWAAALRQGAIAGAISPPVIALWFFIGGSFALAVALHGLRFLPHKA